MTPESEAFRNLLARAEADGSVVDTAYAHNYLFETRVSAGRQRAYEAVVGTDAANIRAWKDRHKSYVFERVYVKPHEVPETFASPDSPALLGAIAAEQYVVRFEHLGKALDATGYDLAQVEEQLLALRSGRNDDERRRSHAFLSEFCDHWNRARGQHRPSFATFLDEIEADLTPRDWADRVRDRLGLSHHNVTQARPTIPVALVRYRAGEVLDRAGDARSRAFAVPTTLDSELNSHFFPAPPTAVYGRTLDLRPDPDCERLASEIVHWRIDYTPEHIFKLGHVTRAIPATDRGPALATLRNEHLFCLRYHAGDDTFGREIPVRG